MKKNEIDAHKYDDIIELPHPVSKTHPQMSMMNRAAQFAPFAALTGFEDAVSETARLTDGKVELDENSKELLDEKLQIIKEHLKEHPEVNLTYFKPDEKKAGGKYVTETGALKKIDLYNHSVVMEDGRKISIDHIIDIQGEVLKYFI